MDFNSNTNTPAPSNQPVSGPVVGHKSHWFLVAVIIFLLAGALIAWFYSRQMKFDFGINNQNKPKTPQEQEAREDVVIKNEIESVDVGDLDAEFNSIDSDLNSL